MLHCFTLVAVCVTFILVGMRVKFGLVKNYFSFVILMCILAANFEDWRRLNGSACITANNSSGVDSGGVHTAQKTAATFGAQIEDEVVPDEGDSFVYGNTRARMLISTVSLVYEDMLISAVPFFRWLIYDHGYPSLYSNFLKLLFWFHFFSFGIRCFNFCNHTRGDKCCSTSRLSIRVALAGVGLLIMWVLRWSYGDISTNQEPR